MSRLQPFRTSPSAPARATIRTIPGLLITLLAGTAWSSNPGSVPTYKADNGRVVSHLPNGLTAIAIDRKQRTWIGTDHDGLYQLQGTSVRRFDTANSPLIDLGISALGVDPKGQLWVGTRRGYIYRLAGDTWFAFANEKVGARIREFAFGSRGETYVCRAGSTGLLDIQNDAVRLVSTPQNKSKIFFTGTPTHCENISTDRKGTLYLSTGAGHFQLDANKRFKTISLPEGAFIEVDPQGKLLYALGGRRIDTRSTSSFERKRGWFLKDPARSLVVAPNGTIYALHDPGSGFTEVSRRSVRPFTKAAPFAGTTAVGVAFAQGGKAVIPTFTEGVFRSTGKGWTPLAKPKTTLFVEERPDPTELPWRDDALVDQLELPLGTDTLQDGLADPLRTRGKKIRFVGHLKTDIESSVFSDQGGQDLPVWVEFHPTLDRYQRFHPNTRPRPTELRTFVGYLEYGGYFGKNAGYAFRFLVLAHYEPDAYERNTLEGATAQLIKDVDRLDAVSVRTLEAQERRRKSGLVGSWALSRGTRQGKTIVGLPHRLHFSETSIVSERLGDAPHPMIFGTYGVSPQAVPSRIDLRYIQPTPANAREAKIQLLTGLYAVNKTSLKMCLLSEGERSGERPETMQGCGEGFGRYLEFVPEPEPMPKSLQIERTPSTWDAPEALTWLSSRASAAEGAPTVGLDAQGRVRSLHFTEANYDPKFLSTANSLPGLNDLYVDSDRLSAADVQRIVALKTLEVLSLRSKQLTDRSIQPLSRMTQLRQLRLSSSQLTNGAGKTLRSLRSLRRLSLPATSVTSAVLPVLAAALPSLVTVELSDARLNSEHLDALAQHAYLEYLDLSRNQIAELTPLGSPPRLQGLDLRKTLVTREAVRDFQAIHPNCFVRTDQ
jgi:hypothetical protein